MPLILITPARALAWTGVSKVVWWYTPQQWLQTLAVVVVRVCEPDKHAYRRCPLAGPARPIRSSVAFRPPDWASSTLLQCSLIRAVEGAVVARAGAPGARLGPAAGSVGGTVREKEITGCRLRQVTQASNPTSRGKSHLDVTGLRLLLYHPLVDDLGSKLGAAQLPRRLVWVNHHPGRVRRDRHPFI